MPPGGVRATRQVLLLVLLLAGGAVAVASGLPLPRGRDEAVALLPLLALLVAVSELLQVRFRVGRNVDGSNLVEAVLVPLLVIAPDASGVLAVAVGQLAAAVVRRNTLLKSAFNVAQWSLATAIGATVWNVVPGDDPASPSGALALGAAVLSVGLVNVAAFSAVLLLNGADLRALRPMVGAGWALGLGVNALLGLLFAVAHQTTPYALLLVPVPLVVLHLAYRGYAAARADRARLDGMHRAALVLSEPLDPRKAFSSFLVAVGEVFETEQAALVLNVEDTREVHRVVVADGAVSVEQEPQDVVSLWGALSAQLGAVRLQATGAEPLSRALARAGHRDCLAAPLVDGDRVLGALLLLDQVGLEAEPDGQLAVLEALARETSGALVKGRLLDSVLEERRKLATVVGATSDGIVALGEDGVVRSWNPALVAITGLAEETVVGRPEALSRLDVRTTDGAPVDLGQWAGGAALPDEVSVRGADGGRRRLACSYGFADDETGRTLVVVARDVTPVQEFEALRAEFGRLVAQEAARRLVVEQLQAAVVPDALHVEGLELAVTYVASDPQEPTGGDLYDWHLMPDGELYVAVVDVLGHGVAATKSALSVVHTLRALALDDTALEDMVSRAAMLLERSDDELVATVVLARLHPTTGRLRVVSGGHPPALVVSAGGRVRQITATGGAIGWPGAGSHGVEELVLGPGDALLLYTDGLVEARKDILAGLDELAVAAAAVAHLPAADLTDELVARALDGADRRDDTLALVVRRGLPALPGPPPGRWELRPDRLAAQQARREAVRWMADRGLEVGDAALVIAELLANAVRVARGVVVLELRVETGRLAIVVTDDGPGLPELPDDTLPPEDAEGSRGLFLVRKLSEGLVLDTGGVGTTVRCWVPAVTPVHVPGQVSR